MTTPVNSPSTPLGDAPTDASKGLAKATMGVALVTVALSLMTVDAGVVSGWILATGTALTAGGWSQVRGAQKRLQDKKQSELKVKEALSEAEAARRAEAETRKKLLAAKSESESGKRLSLWKEYTLGTAAVAGVVFSAYLWWSSRNAELERKSREKVLEEKLNKSEGRSNELEDRVFCSVCLEKERSHAFLPCKHIVCCEECAQKVFENGGLEGPVCPMCRKPVERVEKHYY